ncbi:hypothetical protein CYMTET_18032 [Cymbomonas tetramitiformis]|uniref:EF-hand domain-containing protein n=1 Tax=Cymbomonas tetramitiformis TaxID=36881 RepID=A0AAE0G8W9_9CHLO|nr:hypothetical protein CYMTET_18032 [Cymbomonas tetramitiformis]
MPARQRNGLGVTNRRQVTEVSAPSVGAISADYKNVISTSNMPPTQRKKQGELKQSRRINFVQVHSEDGNEAKQLEAPEPQPLQDVCASHTEKLQRKQSAYDKHQLKKLQRDVKDRLGQMGGSVRKAWKLLDEDQSFHISLDELKFSFQKLNLNVEDKQLEALFQLADTDGTGTVTYAEFCGALVEGNEHDSSHEVFASHPHRRELAREEQSRLLANGKVSEPARSPLLALTRASGRMGNVGASLKQLTATFRSADVEHRGLIPTAAFKRGLKKVHAELTTDEVDTLVNLADQHNSGAPSMFLYTGDEQSSTGRAPGSPTQA